MKKMFLVAYLCAFSLIGLMSMESSNVVDRDGEKKDTEEKSKSAAQGRNERNSEEKEDKLSYQTAGGPEGGPGLGTARRDNVADLSEKENEEFKVINNLVKEIIQNIGTDKRAKLEFENYLQDYVDAKKSWKERIKKKAGKAWKATKAGWEKIKENRRAAAVVGGLAALGGGAYFFREGIAQNIGKIKNFSGGKVSSAWEYAREIPGKVKGKFKKR